MKCLSCESIVDPKWKHAIDSNLCPFCGSSIMDEVLKVHLSTLAEVMVLLNEQYTEQLDDWLSSNYNYFKKNKFKNNANSQQDQNQDSEVTPRNMPVPREVSKNFNNQQTIKDKLKEAREKGAGDLILDAEGNPIGVDPEDIAKANELDSGSRNISELKSLEPEIPAVVLSYASKNASKSPEQVAKELEILKKLTNRSSTSSPDSKITRSNQ